MPKNQNLYFQLKRTCPASQRFSNHIRGTNNHFHWYFVDILTFNTEFCIRLSKHNHHVHKDGSSPKSRMEKEKTSVAQMQDLVIGRPGLQSKIINPKTSVIHIQKMRCLCPLPGIPEHVSLITSLTSSQHIFAFIKNEGVLFRFKDKMTLQTEKKSLMLSDHSSIYELKYPLDVSSRFNTILNELLNSYSVLSYKSCKSISSALWGITRQT